MVQLMRPPSTSTSIRRETPLRSARPSRVRLAACLAFATAWPSAARSTGGGGSITRIQALLGWFERMIRTLREAPEIGSGSTTHIDVPMPPGVLAHRADGPTGTMVFLHNLGSEDVEVDLSTLEPEADLPIDVLTDRGYDEVGKLDRLALAGHGYRWIRLCRTPAG